MIKSTAYLSKKKLNWDVHLAAIFEVDPIIYTKLSSFAQGHTYLGQNSLLGIRISGRFDCNGLERRRHEIAHTSHSEILQRDISFAFTV